MNFIVAAIISQLAFAQTTQVRGSNGYELAINSDGSLNAMVTGSCSPQFLAIDPLSFSVSGGSTYLQGATMLGDSGSGGHAGWCPAPGAGDAAANKFLSAAGTWETAGTSITQANLTAAGTDGIAVTGGTNAVIGSGTSIAQHVVDGSHNGYFTSADYARLPFLNAANLFTAGSRFTNTGDTLSGGLTICGQGGLPSNNGCNYLYPAPNGSLVFYNPNQNFNIAGFHGQAGRVTLAGAAYGHPDAMVLIAGQPGYTGVPTLVVRPVASQTAYALQLTSATDESIIPWSVDPDGGMQIATVASKPTCDSTQRGKFWVTQGGSGVQDSVQVCAKDAANSYAWRTIY